MPTVLFVAAHPDDDLFGIGCSMVLHASDPDLRFVLIHATDGEAGDIAPASGVTPDQLGEARRLETGESWKVIGHTPDRHEWLGFPDGNLEGVDREALSEPIRAVMEEERPDVVCTFGPNGITGHPDHIVLSHITTELFEAMAGDGGPGLHRLLYSVIPQSWIDSWNAARELAGLWTWDPEQPFHLRGVPDETVGVDVDTHSTVDTMMEAIRRHRTQWVYDDPAAEQELARSLVGEHWVIAWPPRPPGGPVLTDIFEGLPPR